MGGLYKTRARRLAHRHSTGLTATRAQIQREKQELYELLEILADDEYGDIYLPTRTEIQQAATRIRKQWTPCQRDARRAYQPQPIYLSPVSIVGLEPNEDML
jgi:hypothetical protein